MVLVLYTLFILLTGYNLVRNIFTAKLYSRLAGAYLALLALGLILNYCALLLGKWLWDESGHLLVARLRYFLYYTVSPFIILAGLQVARDFRLRLFFRKRIFLASWIITVVLVMLGLRFVLNGTYQQTPFFMLERYEILSRAAGELISATIGFVMLMIGLFLYEEKHYPRLLGIVLLALIGFSALRLLSASRELIFSDLLDFLVINGFILVLKDSTCLRRGNKVYPEAY